MEQKKLFIFFTYDIRNIGGSQMYTAGKVKYLKENGWEVQCYSHIYAPVGTKAAIPALDEYIQKGYGELQFLQLAPYYFRKSEQDIFFQILLDKVGVSNPNRYSEIIIESHYTSAHFWGELLTARLGARHFVVFLHEEYAYSKEYTNNIDYFYFKWKRNEIIADKYVVNKIFNGYRNVTELKYDMPPTIVEAYPIQDAEFPAINQIQKLDWNICHIGRIGKTYVPAMIEGVAELARRHLDKTINFIFVGDITERRDFIIKTFNDIDNVQLTALGDMVPIPRILFSKVDVVCAISQSALFAANEGILTVVGSSTHEDRTPGVLGYDTEDQVYGEVTFSYCEALENVLVKRQYDGKKYSLPKLLPESEYYKNFWTIVEKAVPEKEYFTEKISQSRIRNWTAIFPFKAIAKNARVIFFGATEITNDYIYQIQSQKDITVEYGNGYVNQFSPKPYCEILATIDEHPENFNNAVEGIERLLQKDYDVILITTFPQQAQAVFKKISQIVPDMTDKVFYYFKILRT